MTCPNKGKSPAGLIDISVIYPNRKLLEVEVNILWTNLLIRETHNDTHTRTCSVSGVNDQCWYPYRYIRMYIIFCGQKKNGRTSIEFID